MNHRTAVPCLSEYGIGILEPDTEEEIREHLDDCPTCREWLATRDLLAAKLSRGRKTYLGEPHPDSDLLALCVVRPEEVLELDREGLRLHLEQCPTCREDLDLMRAAVREARPGARAINEAFVPRPAAYARARGYLAAALAAVLLGGGVLAASLYLRLSPRGAASPTGPPGVAQHPETGLIQTEELSSRDLDGTQVIDSETRLVISKLTVKSGANITFNSGEVVAFGDGFQVAEGARIAVAAGVPSSPGTKATGTRAVTGQPKEEF